MKLGEREPTLEMIPPRIMDVLLKMNNREVVFFTHEDDVYYLQRVDQDSMNLTRFSITRGEKGGRVLHAFMVNSDTYEIYSDPYGKLRFFIDNIDQIAFSLSLKTSNFPETPTPLQRLGTEFSTLKERLFYNLRDQFRAIVSSFPFI